MCALRNDARDVRTNCQVGRDDARVYIASGAKFLREGFKAVRTTCNEHDGETLYGELMGEFDTETGGGAGDDGPGTVFGIEVGGRHGGCDGSWGTGVGFWNGLGMEKERGRW